MKFILVLFLFLTSLFSKFVENKDINFFNPILQIGVYNGTLYIERTEAIYGDDYDFCVEQSDDKRFYALYVVNK